MHRLIVFWVAFSSPVLACLWDRDTPRDEALGIPNVVAAITGRFPRNPPLFYDMRLARVAAALDRDPSALSLYDDAGVACDRLGRGDEAVQWMQRKQQRLDGLDPESQEVVEHRYRLHANRGTFLVHGWLREGADRTHIEVVRAARDDIARALEINPDAHFGREKYQLLALDWILELPSVANGNEMVQTLPNLLGWSFGDIYGEATSPQEAYDAVMGLSGLVVLGNAWESIDVFHSLNLALQRDSTGFDNSRHEDGRNSIAYLAYLRCVELVDAGQKSLVADAPQGATLKRWFSAPDFVRPDLLLDDVYQELRQEAETWHRQRTEFMMSQLKAGRHPDTDSDFWNGYTETSPPALPGFSVADAFDAWQGRLMRLMFGAVVGTPLILMVLAFGYWRRRRRARLCREATIATECSTSSLSSPN